MRKSFTLIEILVVIVIIGIISAFIIVSMSGVSSRANIAKGQVFSNSLKNSLMLNLISEWRLDDASGTTAQDHWGTNPGVWSGAGGGAYTSPSWRTSSECVSGGCLAFDGTDDYVDCGNNVPIGLSSFTFSFWTKTSRSGTAQVAVSRAASTTGWVGRFQIPAAADRNSLFYVTNGYNHDIYRYLNPYGSSSNNTDNKWHYFVGTCDRSQAKPPDVYLDGNLLNGSSGSGLCSQLTDDIPSGLFSIGGVGNYFQGLIDEVRVYNSAIPASQVKENYFAGLNGIFLGSGEKEEYAQRLSELKSRFGLNE
ncbi:MAG: LamG domain-containing protein [Candidatus Pacebacteria bacterium]|nr:LamG domain-containing protein [Candidatus Paceibacterota bacterium]